MEGVYDILKISLPALIVFLTAWLVLRNMIKNDQEKRRQEIVLQNSRTIVPLKLQAYERVVLFLERISLESLLVRVSTPGMSAQQLHSALLTTIRTEFEHNLSQQVYISPQAWEVVRNARSNMIKIINSEFEKLPGEASSLDFSKKLIEKVASRLRKAGFYAGTLHLKIRWSDFSTITRQTRLAQPCNDDITLREIGMELLRNHLQNQPVRLIGFGAGKLQTSDQTNVAQLDLFEIPDTTAHDKRKRLSQTADSIKQKYGPNSLRRGSNLNPSNQHPQERPNG